MGFFSILFTRRFLLQLLLLFFTLRVGEWSPVPSPTSAAARRHRCCSPNPNPQRSSCSSSRGLAPVAVTDNDKFPSRRRRVSLQPNARRRRPPPRPPGRFGDESVPHAPPNPTHTSPIVSSVGLPQQQPSPLSRHDGYNDASLLAATDPTPPAHQNSPHHFTLYPSPFFSIPPPNH
jgi:hypothetical protein